MQLFKEQKQNKQQDIEYLKKIKLLVENHGLN